MEAFRAERIKRGEIETLQDIEQHQRRQSLGIWRQLKNIDAAVVAADGSNHSTAMLREIFSREKGAALGHGRQHVLRDWTLVEGARTFCCDRFQSLGKRRKFHDVALCRRMA